MSRVSRLFVAQLWGSRVVRTLSFTSDGEVVLGRDVHLSETEQTTAPRRWLLKGRAGRWTLRCDGAFAGFLNHEGRDCPLPCPGTTTLGAGDHGLIRDGLRAVYFVLDAGALPPPRSGSPDSAWRLAILFALLVCLGGLTLFAAGRPHRAQSIPNSLLSVEELASTYRVTAEVDALVSSWVLPREISENHSARDMRPKPAANMPQGWVGAEGEGTLSKLALQRLDRSGRSPGLFEGFGPPIAKPNAPIAHGSAKLSPERVGEILAAHAADFDSCRSVARQIAAAGRFTVQWIVAPGGTVREAQVIRDAMGSPAVARCVMRSLRAIRFGPVSETTGASFTFTFAAGD